MVISLTDYRPPPRFDANAWTDARIEGAELAAGPFVAVETITLDPVDADPSSPALRDFTTADALVSQLFFRVVWIDADANEQPTSAVAGQAPRPFAVPADVGVRLGRDLDEAESEQAAAIIADVTGLLTEAVDRDAAWAAALDPVPATLRSLCVEKAVLGIANPTGLVSLSRSIGAVSRSENYGQDSTAVLELTENDERRARRAVYGSNAASAKLNDSIITPLACVVCEVCGLDPCACDGDVGMVWIA